MSLSYPLFLKTSVELTCPTLSDGRKGGEVCTPYVELTERKAKGKRGRERKRRGEGGREEGRERSTCWPGAIPIIDQEARNVTGKLLRISVGKNCGGKIRKNS